MTSATESRETRATGNGEIQRCPYDPKMNDTSWKPTIWYRHEPGKKEKR